MTTVAFEIFLKKTLEQAARDMGLNNEMDIERICDTDFEQHFEFHDAEAFR